MKPTLFDSATQTSEESSVPREKLIALSVVVPISERADQLGEVHRQVSKSLGSTGKPYEFIYVVDGPRPDVAEELGEISRTDPAVRVIQLNRWFGEATALAIGLDKARSEKILTLPAYSQVDPAELPRLLDRFEQGDVDLVVAIRHPRTDSRFNRLQSRVFHWITGLLTGTRYRDISCGVRVMNGSVAKEISLYGELHRFFPLLAYQRGFRVSELPVRQSPGNARKRLYHPGVYLRRLLDILTLFFIFKFTKKPLRFFGLLGSGVFAVGTAIMLYLGTYRLLHFGPIANRPLLILGALLIVLGLHLFSIGLLGEIVIFTHAGDVKDYRIQETRGSTPDEN